MTEHEDLVDLAQRAETAVRDGRYDLATNIAEAAPEPTEEFLDTLSEEECMALRRVYRASVEAGKRDLALRAKITPYLEGGKTAGEIWDSIPEELRRRLKIAETGRNMPDEKFLSTWRPAPRPS